MTRVKLGVRNMVGPRKRLYQAWTNMRNRCNNPRTWAYRYYGGRGVQICPQWDMFEQFELDMGPHPGPGWTLDREDNEGNYEPGNCRWATRKTQARNSRQCKIDEAQAEHIRKAYAAGWLRQADIAKIYGVTQVHVSNILQRKMWR